MFSSFSFSILSTFPGVRLEANKIVLPFCDPDIFLLKFACTVSFYVLLMVDQHGDSGKSIVHLALFSLRTESYNPDATCELRP